MVDIVQYILILPAIKSEGTRITKSRLLISINPTFGYWSARSPIRPSSSVSRLCLLIALSVVRDLAAVLLEPGNKADLEQRRLSCQVVVVFEIRVAVPSQDNLSMTSKGDVDALQADFGGASGLIAE